MKNVLIILGVIVAVGLIYLGMKSIYSSPVDTTSSVFTDGGSASSTIPTSSSGLPLGTPANLVPPSPTVLPSPESESGQVVSINNLKFSPAILKVQQGSTVIFTNNDTVAHTVTAVSFDSGTIQPNKSFSHVFSQKGTFTYKCTLHPTMTGTIIVE